MLNAITKCTENVSDWETIIHKSFAPFRSLKKKNKNKTSLTIRLFVISLTRKKGLRTPVEIASLSVTRDLISLFVFNPFAAATATNYF